MSRVRILKFRLPPVGETRHALTDGTRVLSVGWQGRQLVCWVESTADESAKPMTWTVFTVAMTGDDRPIGSYVGTAQLIENGEPYVVHVYSRSEGAVA